MAELQHATFCKPNSGWLCACLCVADDGMFDFVVAVFPCWLLLFLFSARYYRRYADEPDLAVLKPYLCLTESGDDGDGGGDDAAAGSDARAPLCSVRDLHGQLCCFLELFSKLPMRGLFKQDLLKRIFMVSVCGLCFTSRVCGGYLRLLDYLRGICGF
jgi:hypothetical protein